MATVLGRRSCRKCVPEPAYPPAEFFSFLAGNRSGILANTRATETAVGPIYLTHASVLLPLPRPGVRNPAPPMSAGGKGDTPEQAMAICLMEAVERHSCVFVGDEPLIYANVNEVDAMSPSQVLLFSAGQYAARETWNRAPGSMHGVPEPFDSRRRIGWVPATSLTTGARKLVPAGCAYLWYPFPGEPMYNFADTNGCAAGSTRTEAVLRATLELIERDAVAIWWYNRIRRPAVDLEAQNDSEIQQAILLFESNNRTLTLLDITHDLGIPVYAAISADANGQGIYYGCAADPWALSAIKRAIAELIQFWFWDQQMGPSEDRGLWLQASFLNNRPHLTPHGLATVPTPSTLGIDERLSLCLSGLSHAGVEAYAADLTRPEIAIPVMRVIAPGLQHYGPRFGGDRIYQVPVKLGWLDRPLAESEMNPEVVVF